MHGSGTERPGLIGLIAGGGKGRSAGHTNEWVWGVLKYIARHGKCPPGTPARMAAYYMGHEKLKAARIALKRQGKGETFDESTYYQNKKAGTKPRGASSARERRAARQRSDS